MGFVEVVVFFLGGIFLDAIIFAKQRRWDVTLGGGLSSSRHASRGVYIDSWVLPSGKIRV